MQMISTSKTVTKLTYRAGYEPPMYEVSLDYPTFKTNSLAIGWTDLSFYGRQTFYSKPKLILNRISGCVDFGQLIALMGPSGAGKSTILKTLNGRNKNTIDSNIYLSANRKIKPCFIVQDISEHLLLGLTAFQSLIYSSKLKNCGKVCNHRDNVRKLLAEFMIRDTEHTPVNNCSGGEQKRIAIAMELTALEKPNLLCIDEPTSGLDSNAALVVVQCLQALTRRENIALVTSIHQPNHDCLILFDKLYVLAKGGVCAYEGSPQDLREHLHKSGIECKRGDVPIEILMKVTSIRGEQVEALVLQTKKDQTYINDKCRNEGRFAPKGVPQKSAKFSLKKTLYLLQRGIAYQISQWMIVLAQFLIITVIGAIQPIFFELHVGMPSGCISLEPDLFDDESRGHKYVQDSAISKREISKLEQSVRLLYFSQISLEFLLLVATVLLFSYEIKIFNNEHSNRWYSTGSYYWAKMISETPLNMLISFVFTSCVYWESHQIGEADRFAGYLITSMASALCMQGLGFAIGVLAKENRTVALVVSIGMAFIFNTVSGFCAPIDDIPEGLQWVPYVAFTRYTFEMHMIIIYGFDRCPEQQRTLVNLQMQHDEETKFWIDSGLLATNLIIYRVLALIFLLLTVYPWDFERMFKRPKEQFIVNEAIDNNPTVTYI